MSSSGGAASDAGSDPDATDDRLRWRDQPSWIRWTAYVALAMVVLLLGLTVLGWTAVRRSLPQTSGTIDVPGLKREVTVLRDGAGVPQVYADTAADLFFAQGYVQAQDRFYEMDVRRHLTAGRLSEMFGRDTLEVDKLVRTMGWRRVAEQELARLSPEATSSLESFSAGVNAYLHAHSPNEVSLEYTLLSVGGLDHSIEDWTPADSVAWLKAMAWDLRGNVQDEIDRAMMSPHVSQPMIDELYPPYPYAERQPVVPRGSVVEGTFVAGPRPARTARPAARPPLPPEVVDQLAALDEAVDAVPDLVGHGDGVGSNAWVVDGDHSTTGRPILANDPHLAPSLPGVWYQMGLHCNEVTAKCPFDVSGFTFSGFPGVVIGHNQEVAWGFTNLGPDVSDLYLEAVDGDRYRRGDRWVPLRTRTETIEVEGEEDPFTFTVRSSVHGPLLSDVSGDYASVGANARVRRPGPDRDQGYAVALAWTALQPSRTAQAVFELDAATGWKEFRSAARHFAAPSQNMVYADRAGHIGYQAPGLIPIRKRANAGDYPSPGWDRRYDWTGRHVPFDALPSELDPSSGVIVTANQAPVGPGYRYHLGDDWDPGQRSQRILDLLEDKGTLGVDDMSSIQLDVRDPFAPTLVRALLAVDAGNRYYSAGQALLEGWDLHQDADSAPAAYYNAVWRNLLHLTFDDELPAGVVVEGGGRWFDVVARLLEEPDDPWWDDVTTEGVRETRDDVLRRALRDARDELVRLQARRPDGWTWGHQHELHLRNSTIGRSGNDIGELLLNRGPWQLGGGTGIVDAVGWDASVGYEVDWVPSMRMVVSLADLDESTWVNLTGASGHAFSPHYTDQTRLWASGRTRAWAYTRPAVDDSTEDRLVLRPAGAATVPPG